jgi:hypothetical protein
MVLKTCERIAETVLCMLAMLDVIFKFMVIECRHRQAMFGQH